MLTHKGNLWDFQLTHHIVVPTNIGWRADGCAVMGRGVAKDAAALYPTLPPWYGMICRACCAHTPIVSFENLILFPTKPFNPEYPAYSWEGSATLTLVERSTDQLASRRWDKPVALPLVGCGLGGLQPTEVARMLHVILNNRFTLVEQT